MTLRVKKVYTFVAFFPDHRKTRQKPYLIPEAERLVLSRHTCGLLIKILVDVATQTFSTYSFVTGNLFVNLTLEVCLSNLKNFDPDLKTKKLF